ncbi:hypothetical protein [Leucobacter sp. GX24907]
MSAPDHEVPWIRRGSDGNRGGGAAHGRGIRGATSARSARGAGGIRAADGAPRGARWRRVAVLLAAAALFTVLVAPRPAATEAGWSDAERGTASFAALTVPAPVATAQCTGEGSLLGLLHSKLIVHWRLPDGYPVSRAMILYSGAAGLVPVTDTLTGSDLKTTATSNGYTTSITGGLLSAVLGGTRTLTIRIVDASGWQSQDLVATGTWPLLGLGAPSCVVTPPPG